MKKKTIKKKKPVKQKIDVVLASLLNLEMRMKELIKKIEGLEGVIYYPPPNNPQYWPNTYPPHKYDGVSWNHTKPIVGYDGCTGQPIMMDSWNNKNKQ